MKLFNLVLSFAIICYFNGICVANPQIFGELDICLLNIGKAGVQMGKHLVKAENPNYLIYYSLCGPIMNVSSCGLNSVVCLLRKQNGNEKMLPRTVSSKLVLEKEADDETKDPWEKKEFVFTMDEELKCHFNRNKNYSIILKMQPLLLEKPRIIEIDECELEIIMMRPDFEPKCTKMVNGHLIDLRPLKGKNLTIRSGERQFQMTFCMPDRQCGSHASICEILPDQKVNVIGTSVSQHLNFDVNRNQLRMVASWKQGRQKRHMEMTMNCDWNSDLANAKYEAPRKQGERYKFTVDSSYACIIFPPECTIRDGNFYYDLRGLYNPNGGYEISSLGGKKIRLNVCGPLKFSENNICKRTFSQVCEFEKNGSVKSNKGSIFSLSVERNENPIRGIFTEGTTCHENNTLKYRTEIVFVCSFQEKKPVFQEEQSCVIYLIWETPKACPHYNAFGKCYIADEYGHRDISSLYTEKDKIHHISPKATLKYNICGPLHSSCNGVDNVSACLVLGNQEHVIGLLSEKLIDWNGNLQMLYQGQNRATLNMNFKCNQALNSPPPELKVIEDRLIYNLTIYSPKACSSQAFLNCSYSDDRTLYNLKPLMDRTNNYIVVDEHNTNIEYVMNICGSVINGPEVLCNGNSMVCMRNRSEPNIRKKYTSIGMVDGPRFVDRKLAIKSVWGQFCNHGTEYSSIIYFTCSESEQGSKLLKKEDCKFEFEWRTRYACPKTVSRNCSITKGDIFDLFLLTNTSVNVNINDSQYGFDLCENYVIICTLNSTGMCMEANVNRTMYIEGNDIYVGFAFSNGVRNNSVKHVSFKFQCSARSRGETFKIETFHDGVMNLIFETPVICDIRDSVIPHQPSYEEAKKNVTYKENKGRIIPHPSPHEETKEKLTHKEYQVKSIHSVTPEITKSNVKSENANLDDEVKKIEVPQILGDKKPKTIPRIERKVCWINGKEQGVKLAINEIVGGNIQTAENNYQINFDEYSMNCDGYICKNGQVILPFLDRCPQIAYNHSYVSFKFYISTKCEETDNYNVEVRLKCHESVTTAMVLRENECNATFELTNPKFCLILSSNVLSTAGIAGVASGVFLISALAIGVFFLYKKKTCSYTSLPGEQLTLPLDCTKED